MQVDVVAPTYGTVIGTKGGSIWINIHVQDIHTVHAPFDASITKVNAAPVGTYTAPKGEIGRVFVDMVSLQNPAVTAQLMLEVGTPLYVTDRIRLRIPRSMTVRRGQYMGEILLGSLSTLTLSGEGVWLVRKGDALIGGETLIATLQ